MTRISIAPHVASNESLDDKILSLYSLGMSYQDISRHMEELYGVELAKGTISAITDKIIPLIREWQGRQLEEVYTFVWLDAFVIKKALSVRKTPIASWASIVTASRTFWASISVNPREQNSGSRFLPI